MNSQLNLDECVEAAATCICFNFRKASRAVTQNFDEILQPSGLRSTQLVILLQAHIAESPSIARLARTLIMRPSTLTRNLKPLEKNGLIRITRGEDRRVRLVKLTIRGRKALLAAIPLWKAAQTRFVERLGHSHWEGLLDRLSRVVRISRT